MKICKLYLIDIRLGVCKKVRYAALACIYAVLAVMYLNMLTNNIKYAGFTGSGSWMECMAYCFKGQKAFSRIPGNMQERFDIPVYWILTLLSNLMITLDYPTRSLGLWGHQYILRSGRRQWWTSKYLYVVTSCIISAITFMGVTLAVCLIGNVPVRMYASYDMYYSYFSDVITVFEQPLLWQENLFLVLVCPFLTILTIGLIQLFISVVWNPLAAYILMLVWIVASSYSQKPWLIGNYAMMIRSDKINAQGMSFTIGAVWMISACILIYFIGLILIKRKELIQRQKVS